MKTRSLLFSFLFLSTAVVLQAQWVAQTPMTNPRGQHGAVAHSNGNVYVWGGFIGNNVFTDLEIYNQATDIWTTGAPIPQPTRGMAFELGNDGKIYSFGGFDNGHLNFAYRYDPVANSWAPLANMPVAVWEATAAKAPNGNIIVFGGENGMNAVQIYNPVTDTWTTGTPIPVAVRMQGAILAPNGLIYLLGGFDGSNAIGNVQIYDPVANSWSTGAPMPTPRNQFGCSLGTDGKIYTIGGKNSCCNNSGPFYANVEIYDPVTNTWSNGPAIPMALGETESTTINAGINLFAGAGGAYVNTNYRMTILVGAGENALNGYSIYPNPSQGEVFIGFNEPLASDAVITVTDVAGKAVMKVSGTELCGQQTVTLDLTTVAKGLYTVRIQSQGAQSFSKIVIR